MLRRFLPVLLALSLFCSVSAAHADDGIPADTPPAEWKTPALFTAIWDVIRSGKPVDTRENILKYDDRPQKTPLPEKQAEKTEPLPAPAVPETPSISPASPAGQTPAASVSRPAEAAFSTVPQHSRPPAPIAPLPADRQETECAGIREILETHPDPQDADEMTERGILYLNGLCVERDPNKAAALFTEAATRGHPGAMYRKGALIASGDDIATDGKTAEYWFRLAAEKGYVPAMTALGILNLRGKTIPPDPAKAREWLEKAAEKNDPDALFELGMMAKNGTALPAPDETQAASLFHKAATAGHRNAAYQLALLQFAGRGQPADKPGAIARFIRLAEEGFPPPNTRWAT
ncbi:sel1 repeat family protein [Oxalobacter aliiformigenes]|uniref:Sel1 repeat family protein n=1 Tax=Oxalobacter aliiformigenes TaxID=2946593 RepID=A0A9E9LG39_9BURK|nr:tetratricopeptide repeat protein [Oxalobacter aliiformigenes]WAV92124.1 sel1 repeat family protein [Oxalobacter aliiformigenes]